MPDACCPAAPWAPEAAPVVTRELADGVGGAEGTSLFARIALKDRVCLAEAMIEDDGIADGCLEANAGLADAAGGGRGVRARPVQMSANEGAVTLVSRADTPGKGTGQDHTSNDGDTSRSAAISSRSRREISLGRTRCRSQALLASGDAKRPPNCAQNATWDANALKTGDMPALSPAAREVPMVASRGSTERIPARV